MTHPKAGEWWCPGAFRGRTEEGDTYAGCDGDPACETCKGQSLERVLEQRVSHEAWVKRAMRGWQGRALRGWANLMASRYGRPVYLTGGALNDAVPRDIDVRVVVSASEFEARFGKWSERYSLSIDSMDDARRWHVEIAKMNVQGAGATHLPIDFQVQSMREAAPYLKEHRYRLDDVPELRPPWED